MRPCDYILRYPVDLNALFSEVQVRKCWVTSKTSSWPQKRCEYTDGLLVSSLNRPSYFYTPIASTEMPEISPCHINSFRNGGYSQKLKRRLGWELPPTILRPLSPSRMARGRAWVRIWHLWRCVLWFRNWCSVMNFVRRRDIILRSGKTLYRTVLCCRRGRLWSIWFLEHELPRVCL